MADEGFGIWYDRTVGRWVYRASALGSCVRAMVAARRGLPPRPWPEDFLRRFADGHLHEPAVLAGIGDVIVQDGQLQVVVPVSSNAEIRGHIDGVGVASMGAWNAAGVELPPSAEHRVDPDGKLLAILEVKALADSGWKKWVEQGWDAYPRYAIQASCYMAGLELPIVMCVKNKNNGRVHYRYVDTPPISPAVLKTRVMLVEHFADVGTLPMCPKPMDYPCRYYYLHDEEEKPEPIEAPPLLSKLVDIYVAARAREDRAREEKDVARAKLADMLREVGKGETEDYRVTVKQRVNVRLDADRLANDYPQIDMAAYQTASTTETVTVRKKEKQA